MLRKGVGIAATYFHYLAHRQAFCLQKDNTPDQMPGRSLDRGVVCYPGTEASAIDYFSMYGASSKGSPDDYRIGATTSWRSLRSSGECTLLRVNWQQIP